MFGQVGQDELGAEAASLCGVLHATTAALVGLLARVLSSAAWEEPGIRSPAHWVTWRFGVSTARARSLVRMAERLPSELPVTFEAFRAGELSEDQVAVLVRYLPAHNDAEGLALAKELSAPVLRRTLRDHPFQRPAEEEPEVERRSATFWFREEGTFALSAELPADEGALVERALAKARDELVTDHTPGDEPVSWADAVVHLSQSYLGGAWSPSAERYQVVLHVRADRPGREASVHLGPALPSSLQRYRSCDTTLRYLLEDDAGPVALGRRCRTVPSSLRQVIEARDRGCLVPGCDASRWLHVHHLTHWEDGGATDPANLVCLCATHHRAHHRGELTIEGDPTTLDGLVVTQTATGRVLTDLVGPSPPAEPPAAAARALGVPSADWLHPSGERLDHRWVLFAGETWRPSTPPVDDRAALQGEDDVLRGGVRERAVEGFVEQAEVGRHPAADLAGCTSGVAELAQ
jgi:hypothetical protein